MPRLGDQYFKIGALEAPWPLDPLAFVRMLPCDERYLKKKSRSSRERDGNRCAVVASICVCRGLGCFFLRIKMKKKIGSFFLEMG